jgi:hypothetical protein
MGGGDGATWVEQGHRRAQPLLHRRQHPEARRPRARPLLNRRRSSFPRSASSRSSALPRGRRLSDASRPATTSAYRSTSADKDRWARFKRLEVEDNLWVPHVSDMSERMRRKRTKGIRDTLLCLLTQIELHDRACVPHEQNW